MNEYERMKEMVEQESLNESRALNMLFMDMVRNDSDSRKKSNKTNVICATICLVSVLLFTLILGVLASGIQIETTATERNQTVEGDAATINNGEWKQYTSEPLIDSGVVTEGIKEGE